MTGFDTGGLYTGQHFQVDEEGNVEGRETMDQSMNAQKMKFKKFLRNFHIGGFNFIYRDLLLRRYQLADYFIEVQLEHLRAFDAELENNLREKPAQYLAVFEEAATEIAEDITRPRPAGEEEVREIQIMLRSEAAPSAFRNVNSSQMSQVVKIPGIVISASQVRSKATKITIQCRSCRRVETNVPIRAGFEGYALPRKCLSDQALQAQKCPIDPYFIVADRCTCVDFQVLKLQENPEDVPHGEMPRQMMLYCDRYLTDRVAPGNRVTALGVLSIKKSQEQGQRKEKHQITVGIRTSYVRLIGIEVEASGLGRTYGSNVTPDEEAEFRAIASQPDIYERIARSIAPSIYGSEDIKKAIACLLFGGSRKRLPDGLTRRGDINVLLLGDPGTAKSQLLKFVEKVAPIAVYTSGKGSSAAGLTASVIKDNASRSFVMEGGAMVLADGGVVCIDEFDKMREDDRVAIHEAMEQQTISIAKAGITTTLNSRCSVLAAANSVYGRWDDSKGEDNIDFMPTILSRFDAIFLVKDLHDESRDAILAKHVMNVHMHATQPIHAMDTEAEGEMSLELLKKFISFVRARCGPRLTPEAAAMLRNKYVQMRAGLGVQEQRIGERSTIPITVRQLEAVVRLAESLAKMQLSAWASERHVEEALRIFRVSTLDAAASGNLAGVEGFTTESDHAALSRIETQLKRRLAIGTQVSEHVVLQDYSKQGYDEHTVKRVLQFMIRRGELQHRMQRKMLYRLK